MLYLLAGPQICSAVVLLLICLSPYVHSLSDLSLESMIFHLYKSSTQLEIKPTIDFVRGSRSDPTQVLWAKGKLHFGEWSSQSTETLGL